MNLSKYVLQQLQAVLAYVVLSNAVFVFNNDRYSVC